MVKFMNIQKKARAIVKFLFIWHFTLVSFGLAKELIVSWDPNSEADLAGYKVYWGKSSRSYSDVVDVKNVTSYRVGGLSQGVEYFFAVTAYDTAFNESAFSKEVSVIIPVEDLSPPEIHSVTLKNATELELMFNEKVEKSSAETIANYQINNGISVLSVNLDNDQKTVHITTSQHSPGSYTITVNNITDLAPTPNTIAPNSKASYQSIPDDTTPPVLTDATILDATHVAVKFSEEIEKSSAESIQNYKINNNITIYYAGLDQNNRVVHLVTSPHQSGVTYTLTVNNIRDRATQPNIIAANSSKQYSYFEEDKTPPSIYSVNIRNYNLVDVTFSEEVDQASAQDPQNYAINNGVNVLVAILNINLKTVHLSTTTHEANINYTITINNVLDRANPANKIISDSQYDYIYQPDDNIPPQIIRAEAINGTSVDIIFSEALDRESAEQRGNYQISGGISIIQAALDQNRKTVHLTTTAHESGKSYSVTVNNVKDLAPTPNKIQPNSKVEYLYIYQDTEPPKITNVQIVYATYLKVYFNEIIEKGSAENSSNYSISGGVSVIAAILDNNLNLVHLTTSEHQLNTNYSLTVNNIRDRAPSPNTIAPNTTINYNFVVDSGSLIVGLNRENYRLAYLNVGDKYYIDRNYTITKIPEDMKGYLWIMTANDDRAKKDDNFLSFQLKDSARVFVAYDSRALNVPDWLADNFHRIGTSIGVSEYVGKLDLWEMDNVPTVITLGGNLASGAQGVESMYVVLIESHGYKPPDIPDDRDDPLMGDANVVFLYQNSPNPFNAGTEIRFLLPQDVYVELTIYNIVGQTMRTLTEGYHNAGQHILQWDGKNEEGQSLPSGVYFSRLIIRQLEKTGDHERYPIILNTVRKMVMIK